MHLTCIRAGERPHTEVRAGVEQSCKSDAMDGMQIPRPSPLAPLPQGERGLSNTGLHTAMACKAWRIISSVLRPWLDTARTARDASGAL